MMAPCDDPVEAPLGVFLDKKRMYAERCVSFMAPQGLLGAGGVEMCSPSLRPFKVAATGCRLWIGRDGSQW